MTQADEDLLLKDLCARLPYGVILNCCEIINEPLTLISHKGLVNNDYDIDEVKPYLFPLSNMTEEQYNEMQTLSGIDCLEHIEIEKEWRNSSFNYLPLHQHRVIEFFHKHHFDYRGLIPMGLANDATNKNIY